MPDYIFLLESRIAPEQRAALALVQGIAQAHETNIYLAGGAVRDLITGMTIRDLDFVVEGNPFRLAHELEKQGARLVSQNEQLRHVELIFPGDIEGSVAAARAETFERPGTKAELRWSTAVEDLRCRDFSINAIAISLNPASRGLMLDPTNGLADLETQVIRSLSIHGFTNKPVRLLRAIRYSVRMGFKLEPRTAEWFNLALERGLHENIPPADVGDEVRQLAREEKTSGILKGWEHHGLIGAVHPRLARRHPDYDGLGRLGRARESMLAAGHRIPSRELQAPTTFYLLGRLKSREQSAALHRMEFDRKELDAFTQLPAEADKVVKLLRGPARKLIPKGHGRPPRGKAAEARAVYNFLEGVPRGLLAFIQAEYRQPKALSAIRTYLSKWKPLRASLPAVELETLGVSRGSFFNHVLEEFFDLQLTGKGRDPQSRVKLLRKLAGIKPEPKKKEKPEKKKEEKKARSEKLSKQAAPAAQPPAEPEAAKGAAAARVLLKAAGKQPVEPSQPAKTAKRSASRKPAKARVRPGKKRPKPKSSKGARKPKKATKARKRR